MHGELALFQTGFSESHHLIPKHTHQFWITIILRHIMLTSMLLTSFLNKWWQFCRLFVQIILFLF